MNKFSLALIVFSLLIGKVSAADITVSSIALDDVWGEASNVHLISLPSRAERGELLAMDEASKPLSPQLLAASSGGLDREWENIMVDPMEVRSQTATKLAQFHCD